MAGSDGGNEPPAWGVVGKVTCAAWIRRSAGGANRLLVVYGRADTASSPPILDLFAFDARACTLASEPLLRVAMGEDEDDAPRAIAVHPDGDEFVCATAKGCRGSRDGDCCVVDVQSMQVSHLIKKVHLGSPISSIEFCPTERIVISTSHQWGAEVTKLDVPADWRVWQIWLLLLSFFVASAVAFYTFFKHTTLL
ncbi:hypothetical protein ACQ4PT_038565 [Festuca glaucescens]